MPLTGTARKQYLARALASPGPDLEDELEKLGFQGASELANSRDRLRGHITAIHERQIAPLPGSSRVSDYMPRAEPIGPGRKNAAADRKAEDEARLRGMDIEPTLQSAAKVTNTAGNVLMDVLNPLPSVSARLHGEDPGASGYAIDAAGFLPLVRGPRAVVRGVKALQTGKGASAAIKAGRASLKETGPITKAVRSAHATRTFKVGDLEKEIPAARSRTGRAGEALADKSRPLLSKTGAMKTESARAGLEVGFSTRTKQRIMSAPADALIRHTRLLPDAQEYAIRIIADGPSPEERAIFFRAEAAKTANPEYKAYLLLHADVSERAAKYIKMVNDPVRGHVADLADDAPKRLKKALAAFDEAGGPREKILSDYGLLANERMKARVSANMNIIRGGARYENPTPGKLGKTSSKLRMKQEQVARLEKAVARAEEIVSRKKYTAADLKRAGGAVAADPELETRLQANLDVLNKMIADARTKPPKVSDEVVRLREERVLHKRLLKFANGLEKLGAEYGAEAQKLGVSPEGTGVGGPAEIAQRIEDLTQMIHDLGGKIPMQRFPEIEAQANAVRRQLKKIRANPQSIQDGNRIITPKGEIIYPIGQVHLDRLSATLSVLKGRLQQAEEAAARRVKPTGIVGGMSDIGLGRSYAPAQRGIPVSVRSGATGVGAYFRRVKALMADEAFGLTGTSGVRGHGSTLFGGGPGKVVGRGPNDDAHIEKAYKGSLLLSGFFTKRVGRPMADASIKAAKIAGAAIAHPDFVAAGRPMPGHASDIPVLVDVNKPVGYAAKQGAQATRERLSAYFAKIAAAERGETINWRDLQKVDMQIADEAYRTLFPAQMDIGGGAKRVEEIAAEMLLPGYLGGPIENVVWVPRDFLDASRLLHVPAATKLAMSGLSNPALRAVRGVGLTYKGVNDLVKASFTFLNPAYMGMQLTGNGVMLLLDQHVFLPRSIMQSVQMHMGMSAIDRLTIDKVMDVGGTMALKLNTAPGEALQATLGKFVSMVIDLQPRRLAFLHYARQAGYNVGGKKGMKDISPILKAARGGDAQALQVLDDIGAFARPTVVDFSRLGPIEREYVSQFILFYPWLRGASSYSVKFIANHPLQAAAMALMYDHAYAAAQEQLGDRPYYAQSQFPISTDTVGLDIPGTNIGVGLDQLVGSHAWIDDRGNPMTQNDRQLFTQTTLRDILRAGISFATTGDRGAASDVVGMAAPVLGAGITALTGYDSFTQQEVPVGLDTFFEQLSPKDSPVADRYRKINATPEERAAYQQKALNPRSKGQEIARAAVGVLAPAPYNKDVAQRRALESKPALERKWGTLLLDSEKYNVGTPSQGVFDDLATKVKIEKLAKDSDSYKEKAIAARTIFDETHGTNSVRSYQTEAAAKWDYESLLPWLYPEYLNWEKKIADAKAEELSRTPAGTNEPTPGR